ncbi:GntR family transcriptional regulator [Agreia sp. VKM Ac-1783]|uniref:GntR family transcriptional regulator n=1 Tax=Agreia sp. VKM Ac-1783 TaxID=1938889 RepID=UPI000A2AC084|nr:GntR family transcriptional regulator [Agreia sp. VKM Ac-1783]SMQ73701.1 GntR family transcriptional regulator [Agreia sp. VKM Ac-1783]
MSSTASNLVERIREWIAAEEFSAGERIGTERLLAEALQAPRSAIRAALAIMEASGEIHRSMGRSGGIFIPSRKIERQLDTIEGVPSMLRRQGMLSRTHVLEFTITIGSPLERRNLGLDEGDNVYRLVRLREADNVPLSVDTAVLPAKLYPRLTENDLTESLYETLAHRYNQRPVEADESIDVIAASATQASQLGIETGDPVFSIWRMTKSQSGAWMELANDIFRADRTRIQSRRHGGRWKHVPPQ